MVHVAAVILFDGPKMLVNRRPEGGYFGGWWEWPGGKLQPGESPQQCARRELEEEIGLQAGPLVEFDAIDADYPGRTVHVTFFLGRPLPGSRPKPDALEHRWVNPDQVARLQFLEANLPVLRRLIESPPKLP